MGCCSTFNDKLQECEFLIEEFKLIMLQTSSNNYKENEQKALEKFKIEKKDKIKIFIDELEKNIIDEIQKRKILKLRKDFNEVIYEEENSNSNNSIE